MDGGWMKDGWLDGGWMASSEKIEWEADAPIAVNKMYAEIFDEAQY